MYKIRSDVFLHAIQADECACWPQGGRGGQEGEHGKEREGGKAREQGKQREGGKEREGGKKREEERGMVCTDPVWTTAPKTFAPHNCPSLPEVDMAAGALQ